MSLSQTVRRPSGSTPARRRWDVIVIGCGIMGASVSYNLAKKGLRVLTIERFGVNHEFGSSHSKTRIIRLAYYEDPRYVPLLRRAFDSWREVESKAGRKLLRMTGGLMMGKPDGELVTGVLKSAKAHGLPYEVLSSSEVEDRFEAFTIGAGMQAVYDQTAGILFAEECVRALVGLASEAGCDFRFSEEVTGWKSGQEGVEVETSAGTQYGDKLILCAGAWSGKLSGGVLPLQCERQVPMWFPSHGLEIFSPPKMPVFMAEEGPGIFYYGLPDVGHGVKVARTHGGEISDPEQVRREVTDEDVKPVSEFISRRLKKLDRAPIASTTCIYSNTPDLNFAVGPLPGDPKAIVLSVCSGHGFKFASVMGEVVAQIATGDKPPYDLSFLSPDRFAKGSRS